MSPAGSPPLLARPTRVQQRKLRQLLTDAATYVPYYHRRYGKSCVNVTDPACLAGLPLLTKQALLATSPEDRLDSRYAGKRLLSESTTGSTGQPFTISFERSYRLRRNLRFYRALMSAGYRPWHRLMLLTDRYPGGTTRIGNRYYVSVEQTTAAIRDAYLRVRPQVLYGFVTPLRLLAEYLQGKAATRGPRVVVTSAELLDPGTRRLLEHAFGVPVCDFYGMTEMGLAAWQLPGGCGYIMSSNSVLTEFLPVTGTSGRYRIIMTNLDLHASPVIRFDTGDVGLVRVVGGRPRLMAIEGRIIDTVIRRDGSEVSPYRITDALRDVRGLRRFKVTQRRIDDFVVDAEIDASARTAAATEIRRILERLIGEPLGLEFNLFDRLVPEGTQKFRPVESRVSRP